MRTILKSVVAAAVLAAGTIGAAAPAQARWHDGYGYHGGYYHHGGIGTGGAIGLGLLGLGVGAAIASADRGPRYEGYYAPPPPPPPAYGYGYGYYAPPPPPPPAYGYGYSYGYGW